MADKPTVSTANKQSMIWMFPNAMTNAREQHSELSSFGVILV